MWSIEEKFIETYNYQEPVIYCSRAHIHRGEQERKALFFIIAGSNQTEI
jgi:hypothetical protein